MIAPTIALANDFLEAFAQLPRAQQRKVREFTHKFKQNPTSSAINYEKISGVRDDKVRTVRIDQKYRAVILQPREGNVYILVWVDNHDEAMDWARNKVFEINPATGALQIVNVTEVTRSVSADAGNSGVGKAGATKRLFDGFDDQTLTSFGVPPVLLPAIRAVPDSESLSALIRHLPSEASEALVWLAEGIPVDEVRATVAPHKNGGRVDTSDFAAALDNPDSRRRFVKIKSQDELDSILDAPLEKWRIFLHPTQEDLVHALFKGPARVLGGAGTGKTVVAMHRARHLAKDVFTEPRDRILFTTFTANLAGDVEQNLRRLCGPECDRIEVVHLHAWAARYLRSAGVGFRIASDDDVRACWDATVRPDAEPWTAGFLAQEWDQVVQVQGIDTEAAYLTAPRTGRGRTLSRPQRVQVWRAFERFVAELRARGLKEWLGVIREARQRLQAAGGGPPYRAVVVDEAQDFHAEEWRLIRALAAPGPNDLFIVGDAHQRIYARKVTLSRCGVSVVGRSRKLKINYRTTEQIRAWAVAVLDGGFDDLDGGVDDQSGYRSLLSGPAPQIEHFDTAQQEKRFLEKTLGDLASKHGAENVCLVARTNKALAEYVPILDRLMLPHSILDKAGGDAGGGVRLATMHRVKGLEFPCMVLAGVNSNVLPLTAGAAVQDPLLKSEHEARERSLLYVAATRARDKLLVTSWGTASPFIEPLRAGRVRS